MASLVVGTHLLCDIRHVESQRFAWPEVAVCQDADGRARSVRMGLQIRSARPLRPLGWLVEQLPLLCPLQLLLRSVRPPRTHAQLVRRIRSERGGGICDKRWASRDQ